MDEQGRPVLHRVSSYGYIGVTQRPREYEADPQRADKSSQTLLHEAVNPMFDKSGELMQLLLENGAEVEVRDRNLRTPLHEVAKERPVAVMQLPLDKGMLR